MSSCIVFGGSSGIGEATALHLAAHHAVTIVGRDQSRLAQALARLRTAAPAGRFAGAAVDAADPAALHGFFAGVGACDHLVLCHSGGKGAGPFASLDLADLRAGLEAKLFAQLQAAQAALPILTETGSITFVSAITARCAMPGTAGLAAINAAIEAVVRVLAKELAPRRVNAVSPGVIDTPWWNAMPAAAKESYFAQASGALPVRRVGRPEDVAQAIGTLVANGFMTGTILEVDGGAHLG